MIRDLNELWVKAIVDNIKGIYEDGRINLDLYFDTYRDTAVKSEF